MNSEKIKNIIIKEELHEEMTYDDSGGELMDALFLNETFKLENEVEKELREEFFVNDIDDNTKYLCDLCKSYFTDLSALQDHMQTHDSCDEKNDTKSSEDRVSFEETKNTEVKEECNEKKTKRKRQHIEEKYNEISMEKDVNENNTDELANLIRNDYIILGKKHNDEVDKDSYKTVKEETEDINETDKDELVNLIMKDYVILRTNHRAENIIKIKTEAFEETLRNPVCEKSNVHAETSDGNNQIEEELSVAKHDTVMNVPIIDAAYDDNKKENASKDCKNRKRRKKLVSKELATENMPNQFECNVCNKSFETSKKLKRHLSNSHKRSSVFCDVCSKKFSRKDNLAQHIKLFHLNKNKTENIQSPIQKDCNVCNKSFETSKKLKKHLSNSHKRSSVCCDVCSKKFSRKEYLDRHVKREHLGIKREWKCKFCGNIFTDNSNLRRHTIFYCTKNKNKALDKHMKPINVTKISCEICRRKYVSRESLEMHMADHPKYVCDYCDKTYYNRRYLELHIKRHHLNMRFRSKKCGNGYVTRFNLNRHLETHPQCDKNIK